MSFFSAQHLYNNPYASAICTMGLENQLLLSRALDLGLLQEAEQLQHIDRQLLNLFYKSGDFNFIAQVASGRTLLVGEGNLSFALELAKHPSVQASQIIATTFEGKNELSNDALANAAKLKNAGATILHNVDATYLKSVFGSWKFDTIVFQFAHTGSREAIEGHNPNFILVRDFLLSAIEQLLPGGVVLISAIDSPHYQGAFQFEEAASIAGFLPPENYPFDLDDFPGYIHTMTNEEESALDADDDLRTWVFKQ